MKTVHKFQIPIANKFELKLRQRTRFLRVELENGVPYLWALVDTQGLQDTYNFRLVGDDDSIEEVKYTYAQYVGSLLVHAEEAGLYPSILYPSVLRHLFYMEESPGAVMD